MIFVHGDKVLLRNTHSAAMPGMFLAYVGPRNPDGNFDFAEVLTRYGVITTEMRHVEPQYKISDAIQ